MKTIHWEIFCERLDKPSGTWVKRPERTFHGWNQSCECDTDETEPGIVLDPFAGAGTTCLVAKRLHRRFVGIELNPEYVSMAQARLRLNIDNPDALDEDNYSLFADFNA